jgi:hypothetical protein
MPAIGSDYVAMNMYGVVSGKMKSYPAGSLYENNTCDVNRIANPDNVTFITGKETLIIGEDTGSGHQNDAIWSYNIISGDLTRIETTTVRIGNHIAVFLSGHQRLGLRYERYSASLW